MENILTQDKVALAKDLQGLETMRLELRASIRKFGLIALGVVAVGLVTHLISSIYYFTIGGGVIAAIIYGIAYFTQNSKYKTAFKQKLIPAILKAISPGLTYNYKNYISEAQFRASRIFTEDADKYSGEDYFSGKIGLTEVEFSELHAQEKHTTTDSKGRTQTRYVTFFKGLFMIADFHKDFKGSTLVLPDTAEKTLGWLGKKLQSWNISRDDLVYLEDPEFEKEFVVYGSDQVEARYILSTNMMRRILDLKTKFKCPIYLSFLNSKVYLAINSNADLLEPSLSQSLLDDGAIKRFFDEIQLCVDIIDQLNLNTRIWSKQEFTEEQ